MINKDKILRYKNQIILKEFGQEAQRKLSNSKILVIGSGGLGCPALIYLAAAGAGNIGIVDFDIVELSNLHRQILYEESDIGNRKTESALTKLKAFNSDINFRSIDLKISNENALDIISDYDLVIDCTDNFLTRYVINDACCILNKPLIYGAVLRFEGQVGVFCIRDKETNVKTNYRDLYPKPPDSESGFSCNETGVIGVLPGIIGTMQAAEAIKIITGIGKPLINKIVSFNALNNSFYDFFVSPSKGSDMSIPKNKSEFLKFDYKQFCSAELNIPGITVQEFYSKLTNEKMDIIDVREWNEKNETVGFDFRRIPLSEFDNCEFGFRKENTIIFFCQTGIRSIKAVKILNQKFPGYRAYSLIGGIDAFIKYRNEKSINNV